MPIAKSVTWLQVTEKGRLWYTEDNMKLHIHSLPGKKYVQTMLWAVGLSSCIVAAAAALGRATFNFQAALTDKPDVAIYLLLPEEDIGVSTLLRENESERHYLAETKDGPKLITLKKGEEEWYVGSVEKLHE